MSNDKVRLNKSRESFTKNLIEEMSKLDKNKPVKCAEAGSDGPMVAFYQDDKVVFKLPVYHGEKFDHRQEFITLAKDVLVDHDFDFRN